MKKIILATFITFSILSCSTDNDSIAEETVGINRTLVTAKIGVGKDAFPTNTGKNVYRGTIPTTINQITVDVVNNDSAIPPTKTIFDLVANNTAGAEDMFYIDDVTSGDNVFTAKAYTTAAAKVSTTPYTTVDSATTDAMLTAQKSNVPYAYYQAVVGKNIILGQSQEIQFPLTTLNGRIIALIETGPTLTAINRKVEVIGDRHNPDGSLINSGTIDITGTKSALLYWSDTNSVKDAYVNYTVNIYNAAGDTVEKTFTKKITVIESTGITSKNTITFNGITEDINYGTFTIPEWTEINE